MLGRDNADAIIAATAYDDTGDKIGSVGRLYLDDASGDPAWVSVSTGLFGNKESFVPLAGGSLDGDRLNVAVTRDAVKNAPQIELDDEHLGLEQAQELYRYYGVPQPRAGGPLTPPPLPSHDEPSYDEPSHDEPSHDEPSYAPPADSQRADTAGSEPVAASDTTTADPDVQETGQPGLRLRRHVVVEEQTITVPVVREEYILEGEPQLDDAREPHPDST